jgi:FixJ family two-component response regulator
VVAQELGRLLERPVAFPVTLASMRRCGFPTAKKNWREPSVHLHQNKQGTDPMAAEKPLAYVVDDEETIAKTLSLILNASGFEAIAFTLPLEALRAAETRRPDFLITDVSMPLLNGIELGIQFKAIYPDCKVLLFSGAISTGPLLNGAAQRGFDFTVLAKPVHPLELLEVLKRMGHR